MKEVKEKQRMKAPKTHDPTRRMPRTAQKAYGKVNEIIPAGEEQYQSADDYAVQKSEEYTQETADKAYHGAKKTVQKTKDEVRDIHDRIWNIGRSVMTRRKRRSQKLRKDRSPGCGNRKAS